MNWITRWKKIGIKVKQIFKKQPLGQEATDWKNCPQCKKISYKPDFRQSIADSWPCSIDDKYAKKDWGWKLKYDLEQMTTDMMQNLKKQNKITV